RPSDFKRRILTRVYEGNAKDVRDKEQLWLNQIKLEELGIRYYNAYRGASGADRETAKKLGRRSWDKMTPEQRLALARLGGLTGGRKAGLASAASPNHKCNLPKVRNPEWGRRGMATMRANASTEQLQIWLQKAG